jgi:acetyl-CoA C-acetyltransferase
MSGTQDVVIAGGVQNMTMIPIAASMMVAREYGHSDPFSGSKGWTERYGKQIVSQFAAAEMIAHKFDISREDMEKLAYESHRRAIHAIDEGRFEKEIVPYGDFTTDEGPRRGTTMEKMAELKTLAEGGRITAATASQISDGAAAILVVSEKALKEYNLTPRARVHHLSVRGASPIEMLTAPIPATEYALKKTGMSLDDMDVIEINEAFASVVLAWRKETGANLDKVNINGGAMALGHPLGATGARLMTTMLNELERTGGKYGFQTMCEGGGQANVTILERL